MSILLPYTRGMRTGAPSVLDFGGVLTPPGGGATQRFNRVGDRYTLTVTPPLLRSEPDGRVYVSRLRRALREGAIFAFPQDGLVIGSPGSPLVNGAGQTGTTLNIDGMTPGYIVREGQFFSIIIGGRRYLYAARAQTAANGSGQIALPIEVPLRVSPTDNAVCEFAAPMIEGFLAGDEVRWELLREPFIQIPDFTITEAE